MKNKRPRNPLNPQTLLDLSQMRIDHQCGVTDRCCGAH